MTSTRPAVDVVIVGYGPVGATAANLLGRAGLRVIVLDRETEIYDKPRAIVVDHEALRVLQMCRLPGDLNDYFEPYRGSHFIGADGDVIRRVYPPPGPPLLGWPSSASFVQPEVERLLRHGVDRLGNFEVLLEHEVTGIQSTEGHATLCVKVRHKGTETAVAARYVLGCDGARSIVRRAVGTGLEDLRFDEEWLVIDAWITRPVELPEVSIQYCQPTRPATFVRGPRNLRRWELRLMPGETAEMDASETAVRSLLSDYVDVSAIDVWRSAVYRFHGLVAHRWRRDNVFLLGDAAHQTPPFTGQGLCSGLRDAANLAWKIDHVERLGVAPGLLASYEIERRAHFRAIVERSLRAGKIVGELDPAAARRRDAEMLEEMAAGRGVVSRQDGIPPLAAGLIARDNAGRPEGLAGSLFPQPMVSSERGDTVLLEDVIAPRFAFISADTEPMSWFDDAARRFWSSLDGERLVLSHEPSPSAASSEPLRPVRQLVDADGLVRRWLSDGGALAAIIRPDRYVYATAASRGELRGLIAQLEAALLAIPAEQEEGFTDRLRPPGDRRQES